MGYMLFVSDRCSLSFLQTNDQVRDDFLIILTKDPTWHVFISKILQSKSFDSDDKLFDTMISSYIPRSPYFDEAG